MRAGSPRATREEHELATGPVGSVANVVHVEHDLRKVNDALLSLPGQLGAEDSTLQWIARATGIADWTGAAPEAIGLGPLAGGVLFVVSIGRWSF